MRNHFPCTDIHLVVAGREFCNPKRTIRSFDRRFRSCTSEGRARCQQKIQPMAVFDFVIIFQMMRCIFKCSELYPRRRSKCRIIRKEWAVWCKRETQCSHASLVINAEEKVAFLKFPRLFTSLPCTNGFPFLHQDASPTIRRSILKHTEQSIDWCILSSRKKRKVRVEKGLVLP